MRVRAPRDGVALAQTGVAISDGAVTIMPVAPQRAPEGGTLTPAQVGEPYRRARRVEAALRRGAARLREALPGLGSASGQLPTRHAAVVAFFLEGRDEAADAWRFVEKAAQATLFGNVFDDAATGQGC